MLIPRVVGEDGPYRRLVICPDDDHCPALVDQRAAEEDEAVIDQAVDEGGVLIPEGLLPGVPGQVAIRAGGRGDHPRLHFASCER